MKINTLIPQFVDTMPDKLEYGILYISMKYNVCIHLCACGECGMETVIPIMGIDKWDYKDNNGLISLSPSIGNWQFPCKSHYYVIDNQIRWL